MYNNFLYHGTEIKRGKEMILEKQMRVSRGDNHWLGDGSYFYEDEFYAFKWIKDMYRGWFKKEYNDIQELMSNYIVIKANIKVPIERVFNLDSPITKIEFDRVYMKCKEKLEHSNRFKHEYMSEGVVLNIMFSQMGYNNKYDMVVATFKMRENRYKGESLRLNFISEKQYCIKNINIVDDINIKECSEDDIKTYNELISNLNFNDNRKNYNVYKSKNRSRKFKSFKS